MNRESRDPTDPTDRTDRTFFFLGSVALRFGGGAHRAGGEGQRIVGMRGVEAFKVVGEEFGEVQLAVADALGDAFGQFVAAVIVVMGAVLESLAQVGAERGVELLAHRVEVDQGGVVLFGNLDHGGGVAFEGVLGHAVLTLHRGDQDRGGAAAARVGDHALEVFLVGGEGVGFTVFHVVVAHLDHDPVALAQEAHDLVPALFAEEAGEGLAGLGVVGDGENGAEEARQHLAPGVPGFLVLVGDGGVADEKEGGGARGGNDFEGADGGVRATEFQGQFLVPVGVIDFAGFEPDATGGGDFGTADIDGDHVPGGLAGGGGDVFKHQAALLGLDGGYGRDGGVAKVHVNGKVAFGQRDGEERGRVGGRGGKAFFVAIAGVLAEERRGRDRYGAGDGFAGGETES